MAAAILVVLVVSMPMTAPAQAPEITAVEVNGSHGKLRILLWASAPVHYRIASGDSMSLALDVFPARLAPGARMIAGIPNDLVRFVAFGTSVPGRIRMVLKFRRPLRYEIAQTRGSNGVALWLEQRQMPRRVAVKPKRVAARPRHARKPKPVAAKPKPKPLAIKLKPALTEISALPSPRPRPSPTVKRVAAKPSPKPMRVAAKPSPKPVRVAAKPSPKPVRVAARPSPRPKPVAARPKPSPKLKRVAAKPKPSPKPKRVAAKPKPSPRPVAVAVPRPAPRVTVASPSPKPGPVARLTPHRGEPRVTVASPRPLPRVRPAATERPPTPARVYTNADLERMARRFPHPRASPPPLAAEPEAAPNATTALPRLPASTSPAARSAIESAVRGVDVIAGEESEITGRPARWLAVQSVVLLAQTLLAAAAPSVVDHAAVLTELARSPLARAAASSLHASGLAALAVAGRTVPKQLLSVTSIPFARGVAAAYVGRWLAVSVALQTSRPGRAASRHLARFRTRSSRRVAERLFLERKLVRGMESWARTVDRLPVTTATDLALTLLPGLGRTAWFQGKEVVVRGYRWHRVAQELQKSRSGLRFRDLAKFSR